MKNVNRAIENYKNWHKKDPSKVIEGTYAFPSHVYKVGNVCQIFYYSDKWEEDGNGRTYYHDFDSRPSIYVAESSCVIPVIGEERYLKPSSTKVLTGIVNLNGQVALPALAVMVELTIDFGKHKKRIKWKTESPPMCGSKDRKSLIFLCSDGPIIIRGGKMRVTERGIVN